MARSIVFTSSLFSPAGLRLGVLVVAAWTCNGAFAQSAGPAGLAPVLIGSGALPAEQRAGVGGIGDAPLAQTPQSISVIRSDTLRDAGVQSLSGLVRLDPAVGDAYNTVGFIEALQVRGFVLDSVLNYTRDGLPVSNHAPLALENKERIEILRGLSGAQAGTSAPGGLVNYVLKRPTAVPLAEVFVGLSERGTARVHADFGGRFGVDNRFGYRVNVAGEQRNPEPVAAQGQRRFASVFLDARLPGRALLEFDLEHSRVRQPSVPGFGLIDTNGDGVADTLPAPISTRFILNSQPWALPFESRATTGSLRFQQALGDRWRYGVRFGQQIIRTDDRIAFPDGCSSGPNPVYPGLCGNFDVDLYDFRSENERRTTRALDAFVAGEFSTGLVRHELTFGVRRTRYSERFPQFQAYNVVGTTNVFAPVLLPANPTAGDLNTQRAFESDELYLYDAMQLGSSWTLWAGVRHSRLAQTSVRADGSRATALDQSFTTPWASLGVRPWDGGFVYASIGQGIELIGVPNRASAFTNPGQALPAGRSRQVELGVRQTLEGGGLLSLTAFQIDRPVFEDIDQGGGLSLRTSQTREARHRGLEFAWLGRLAPRWTVQAQAMLLDAEFTRSADAALIGRSPTNVAPLTTSIAATWLVPGIEGLAWTQRVFHAGRKPVTADNAVELPSFWQWDTAVSFTQRTGNGTLLTWRAGIDNVLDKRYWREAPTQPWGGTYLFAALPRTFRVSLQARF